MRVGTAFVPAKDAETPGWGKIFTQSRYGTDGGYISVFVQEYRMGVSRKGPARGVQRLRYHRHHGMPESR